MKSSADAAAVDNGDSDANQDDNVDESGPHADDSVEVEDPADGAADERDPAADSEDLGDTEDSAAAGVDEADKSDTPTRRPPGGSVLRWVAAAVLVLTLAGAGVEGWFWYQHHQTEVAGEQATEAAKQFALALTTVDPNALDKNFADVLDGATGEFKDMYSQSSEQLRQALIENKAAAHGTVIDAAVKSATKNKVEVMLFIDQSVSNAASQGPQLDRSRVVMTMEKVDGRWLASKLEMP